MMKNAPEKSKLKNKVKLHHFKTMGGLIMCFSRYCERNELEAFAPSFS